MFRLCWAKYIVDKKFNGYYLWEKVAPFTYIEKVSGENSLVDFFVKDDIKNIAEHIVSKNQKKDLYNSYKSNYNSHIKRTIESTKSGKLFDYGTFDNFMTEFTKIQLEEGWRRNIEYPRSFFCDRKDTDIHANLILFDGVYMIMKTLNDFIKFEEFVKEKELEFNQSERKVDRWS